MKAFRVLHLFRRIPLPTFHALTGVLYFSVTLFGAVVVIDFVWSGFTDYQGRNEAADRWFGISLELRDLQEEWRDLKLEELDASASLQADKLSQFQLDGQRNDLAQRYGNLLDEKDRIRHRVRLPAPEMLKLSLADSGLTSIEIKEFLGPRQQIEPYSRLASLSSYLRRVGFFALISLASAVVFVFAFLRHRAFECCGHSVADSPDAPAS